ncbi:MAG: PEP-CTERM sorting domain-containing protein [Armatimonadota bacterium]|jgi:hypothetical protein|uniref:PEP-CTERM sorting domain-containing protein n=1 Tax=Thermogutta sp. TaxID=1962930 RepID=UPI00321F8554
MLRTVAILGAVFCIGQTSFGAVSGVSSWGCVGDTRAVFGTKPGALDFYDSNDLLLLPAGNSWYVGSYHVNGVDGWDGPTGFYGADWRAPLVPCESKTWWVYIWAAPGGPWYGDVGTGWFWYDPANRDPSVLARMELVRKPTGILDGPAVGTVWTAPPSLILPYYGTTDGLTGYKFKFTLTMIPEPSSMLALSGGVGGLGAIVLKRRKWKWGLGAREAMRM